jgi:hypothetical protein
MPIRHDTLENATEQARELFAVIANPQLKEVLVKATKPPNKNISTRASLIRLRLQLQIVLVARSNSTTFQPAVRGSDHRTWRVLEALATLIRELAGYTRTLEVYFREKVNTLGNILFSCRCLRMAARLAVTQRRRLDYSIYRHFNAWRRPPPGPRCSKHPRLVRH